MASICFNCKEDITTHDSQKMIDCLTTLSGKVESLQKNLEVQKSVLQVPDDAEALDHFTKTKTGEPSRMGSN
jgi:hypothetical protein